MSAEAFLAALRKESEDGSALKASKFRGVYRSDNGTEWEARVGHDSPLVPWRPTSATTSPKKLVKNPSASTMKTNIDTGCNDDVMGKKLYVNCQTEGNSNTVLNVNAGKLSGGPASGFMKSMSKSLSK